MQRWALKGWKAFKSTSKKTSSKRTIKKVQVRNVAKKRRRKSQKSKGFKLPSGLMSFAGPVAYGYIRERLSTAVSNTEFAKKLPVSEFTDEFTMLGFNWGLRQMGFGQMPVIGSVLRAQKTYELGRIGQTIADIQFKKTSGTIGSVFIN